MAIGDALTGAPTDLPVIAPAPAAAPIPQVNPADIVAQLQAYRNAFSGMTGDPALEPAISRFALGLLQPVKPGDTPGGVFSRSGTEALDYYTARQAQERNQLLAGLSAGMQMRASEGQARTAAEGVATSRQQRGVTAAKAPVDIGLLQQQYQKAKADLDLIRQEEAAGVRTPDFIKRKATAEIASREALTKLYEAHAQYYGNAAQAIPGKNTKQTLNVKSVENADGTTSLVSTIVVNGQPYQQVFTPARFTDIRAATDFARKQVDRETPSAWNPFGGKAPYTGTAEEEVARRAKAYMEPSLVTIDSTGKQIPNEQFQQMGVEQVGGPGGPAAPAQPQPVGAPQASARPADFPRETPGQAREASARSVAIIKSELVDARKNGTPEDVAALEKELKNAAGVEKTIGKYPQPTPAAGPMKFERDANGNIVPVGGTSPTAKTKGALAPTTSAPAAPDPVQAKFEQTAQALESARRTVMGYTVRAQREDPQGYRNALSNLAKLQSEMAQIVNDQALEAQLTREGEQISLGQRTVVSPELSAYTKRKAQAKAAGDVSNEQFLQLERSRNLR